MLDSASPQLYCLKFSFKSVDISESYARKQRGCFYETGCTQCMYTSRLACRADGIDHCCLRRMLGITGQDHITDVVALVGIAPVNQS